MYYMAAAHRWPLCAVLMLGMLAACTSDGASPNFVVIRVTVTVPVCPEGFDPSIPSMDTECSGLRLSNASVAVTSGGQDVWLGTTDDLGQVEASIAETGEFAVTVSSPLLVEELISDPVVLERLGAGSSLSLNAPTLYIMTRAPD